MAQNNTSSQAKILELYRVALSNVENQEEIASIMTELGYDSTVIEEGKALLEETRNAYDFNKTEDDETAAAYAHFTNKKEELDLMYRLHRKKAKVVFRNDDLTANRLKLSGILPKSYVKWLETISTFYTEASGDAEIQNKLARLKISAEDLTAGNTLVEEIKTARAEYLKEKGESQDATKAKDAAFAKIDDWMSEFYAVARIGLEDKPQLLEALGKVVKS